MTRWRSCSRRDLRRSSVPFLAAAVLLLLLNSPYAARAQSVTAETVRTEAGVAFELELQEYDGAEILSSLSRRMRSQVVYLIRIYRSGALFFGIFGDRLIHEYRVVHEAKWDAFRRAYRMKTEVHGDDTAVTRSETRYFESEQRFLEELFRIRRLEVKLPDIPDTEEELYAFVQARVTPIRLVQELRLISLFMSSDEIESPWRRVPITKPGELQK